MKARWVLIGCGFWSMFGGLKSEPCILSRLLEFVGLTPLTSGLLVLLGNTIGTFWDLDLHYNYGHDFDY